MSNRKPYVREMKRTWWSNHPFYRFYMLREATVLPLILFTVFLTFGLGALVKGPEAWRHYFAKRVITHGLRLNVKPPNFLVLVSFDFRSQGRGHQLCS